VGFPKKKKRPNREKKKGPSLIKGKKKVFASIIKKWKEGGPASVPAGIPPLPKHLAPKESWICSWKLIWKEDQVLQTERRWNKEITDWNQKLKDTRKRRFGGKLPTNSIPILQKSTSRRKKVFFPRWGTISLAAVLEWKFPPPP